MNPTQARGHYRAQMERARDAVAGRRKRKFKAMITMIDAHPAGTLALDPAHTWVWSDLHLGHANVIEYSDRPFPDVDAMNEALWRAWEETVGPEDTVVVAGDVAMGRCVSEDTWARIRQAPGRVKHLVVGNHDLHGRGVLRTEGFDHVWSCAVSAGPERLVWTHMPLQAVPEGWVNVHGHTHEHTIDDGAHVNVSVEQTGYRPLRLDEVLKRAQGARRRRETDGSQRANAEGAGRASGEGNPATEGKSAETASR